MGSFLDPDEGVFFVTYPFLVSPTTMIPARSVALGLDNHEEEAPVASVSCVTEADLR